MPGSLVLGGGAGGGRGVGGVLEALGGADLCSGQAAGAVPRSHPPPRLHQPHPRLHHPQQRLVGRRGPRARPLAPQPRGILGRLGGGNWEGLGRVPHPTSIPPLCGTRVPHRELWGGLRGGAGGCLGLGGPLGVGGGVFRGSEGSLEGGGGVFLGSSHSFPNPPPRRSWATSTTPSPPSSPWRSC